MKFIRYSLILSSFLAHYSFGSDLSASQSLTSEAVKPAEGCEQRKLEAEKRKQELLRDVSNLMAERNAIDKLLAFKKGALAKLGIETESQTQQGSGGDWW